MNFNIPAEEVQFSVKKIEELTSFYDVPENDWEYYGMCVLKSNLILDDLYTRKIITLRHKKILLNKFTYVSDWVVLNSPDLKKNEKIKKSVEANLLNQNFKLMGLSKFICCVER